jgi:hypothetical protein
MAITRKPAPARTTASVDVEDLINRGGSAPTRTTEPPVEPEQVVPVILRLPATMLKSIDQAVKSRPVRIPRHTWLLEAVHEKLSRDNQADTEEQSV